MESSRRATFISRPTAVRLRMETLIRRACSALASTGARPRRIVFIHVLKTGGTTAKNYLTSCLGGKRGGGRYKLNELFLDHAPTEQEIESARRARFLCGHFSWATLEQIGIREDDYIFTFLREPRKRLHSTYRYLSNYREDRDVTGVKRMVIEKARGTSQLDMYRTTDRHLRMTIDNIMVRQFSGRLTDYPVLESEWPGLLEAAKENLRRLSYIGFQDTYDADFARILEELGMPRLPLIPRDNVTVERAERRPAALIDQAEDPAEIVAAMTPLVRWDEALYAFARELRSQRTAEVGAG